MGLRKAGPPLSGEPPRPAAPLPVASTTSTNRSNVVLELGLLVRNRAQGLVVGGTSCVLGSAGDLYQADLKTEAEPKDQTDLFSKDKQREENQGAPPGTSLQQAARSPLMWTNQQPALLALPGQFGPISMIVSFLIKTLVSRF